jgi:hypothetical protein
MSRGQRGGSPTAVNLSFLDRSRYLLSSSSSFILTRAKWTPFQTHCYAEHVEATAATDVSHCIRCKCSTRFIPLTRSDYVRFEVFTAVTMKNVVFWDIKTPVRTSQETHYVSTTESSQLMLCKI